MFKKISALTFTVIRTSETEQAGLEVNALVASSCCSYRKPLIMMMCRGYVTQLFKR
jgi:hypothetical protein